MLKNTIQKVEPSILLFGGGIEIELSTSIDPFEYENHHFTINDTPIKFNSLTHNKFNGKIESSISESSSIKYHYQDNLIAEKTIIVPKKIYSSKNAYISELIFYNNYLYFINHIQDSTNHESNIYCLDLLSLECEHVTSNTTNINSLALHFNEVYFINSLTQTLYKVNHDKNFTTVSEGLGNPYGIISHNEELILGDQNGSLFKVNQQNQAIFLAEIPSGYKGYYFAVSPKQEIYISIPSFYGKNKIFIFTMKKKLLTFLETFNIVGDIAFSPEKIFYWVEHTRLNSIIYRKYKNKKQKILSCAFCQDLCFDTLGNLYITDKYCIYKINKEYLYELS